MSYPERLSVFESYCRSVVKLDEVQNFSRARIWVLHWEVVVILADGSSQGETLVTEHDSAQEDTANNAIDKTAAGEQNPVEVVCLPELLEEHSLLYDTLLLSSVKTAGIDESELQPGC
jgi:hypothetical protein